MKLFTVGPTQMRKEILDVRHQQVPYFRTTEFSDVMLDSDRLLKKFMNAPESYKSIYLTASGTGALEATIMNCMNETDHVLVINGGTFGQRFVVKDYAKDIKEDFLKTEEVCHEVTLEEVITGKFMGWFEAILRVIAPLL